MSNKSGAPDADVAIDLALVARLVRDQFPEFSSESLSYFDSGWDNALFRLGAQYLVRLPRRVVAADLVIKEQRWLPTLSVGLPISVPVPVRAGQATPYFPWRWSILRWVEGSSADRAPPGIQQAKALGQFLATLHQKAPENAPTNEFRGVPLSQRAASIDERIHRLGQTTNAITNEIQMKWARALDAPTSFERRWIHGDLHPQNLVVFRRRIVSVIDWGDLCAGDVATDLAVAFMLFGNAQTRETLFVAYGSVDVDTRHRAEGWAILFGVILLDTGLVNNPRHEQLGRAILQNLSGKNGQ